MLGWYRDTPYGLENAYPLHVQKSIIPAKEVEFDEHEARALMNISMARWRTALDRKPQKEWGPYMDWFKQVYGWSPNVYRMRVLDLMWQIDLVYYWNGVGTPLHPYTKRWRNLMCTAMKEPLCDLNDGP
jgi:hypothetical protein